ncbi:hypothetical protein ACROYT_G042555 [Oculina patagonica]
MASPVGEKTAGLQDDVQKESSEGSSHSILERWEDFHVKLLVSCWQKQKLEFGKGKATKKEIFNKIASELNTICKDVKVTGEQCSRKWQKLEAAHKKITDHNNNTGADKKSWKYFDEMESCIGGNPNVRPKFTLESSNSSNTTDPASDDSDETDDDEIEGSEAGTSSATKKERQRRCSWQQTTKEEKEIKVFSGRNACLFNTICRTARGK